jgi:RimJ/RimL family protein N-acetyltransferase
MSDDAGFRVRRAAPDDAAAVLAHVHALLAEPCVCVTRAPDEFVVTLDEERKLLAEYGSSDRSLFLIAEASDSKEVAGMLMLNGNDRRSLRHWAELVISVAKSWRRRGVGEALIRHAIEHARAGGVLTRLELNVFASNATAIRLYERMGFVHEGCRRRAVFKDGHYDDNLMMALLL